MALQANLLAESLNPMQERMSLAELGSEIRGLLREMGDVRLALAVKLAAAKRLVDAREGTNLSWEEWSKANVLKPNGEPYRPKSIEELLTIGRSRDPLGKLAKLRAMSRNSQAARHVPTISRHQGGRKTGAKIALPAAVHSAIKDLREQGKSTRQVAAVTGVSQTSVRAVLRGEVKPREYHAAVVAQNELQSQFNLLTTAWERACPEARRQFLHSINARLI